MLHKVTFSIYQTLFICFFLSVAIATVIATPLPPVSRSALLVQTREKNAGLLLRIGRIMPNSNGETWTWVSLKSPPHLFGEEALALCIGPRNCFAVWPTTKEALLPLSAFRVNVPTYPGGQIDHSKLITLNGKANFKSQTYPNYAHLPERSTISKLLENVDELTKQTGVPITGDISYLSASLALLKNEGDLGDPDKTEKDWAPYKKKVEQVRERHEEEQRAKAARQGNIKLSFMLNP